MKNSTGKLTGQCAVITGANSGIGYEIAMEMARERANVVINYVTDEPATNAMLEEIKSFGGSAIGFKADVSKEDEVKSMFRQAISTFGTIDILVNNAGIQKDSPFTQMSLHDWQLVLDVNLTGQFLCAREAVIEFLRRGMVPERSCALGKDHLHELGTRNDPVGRTCQLCSIQGRHQAAYGIHGPGGREA